MPAERVEPLSCVKLNVTEPLMARLPELRRDLIGGAGAEFEVDHRDAAAGAQRKRPACAGKRERADRAVDEVDGALVGGESRRPP